MTSIAQNERQAAESLIPGREVDGFTHDEVSVILALLDDNAEHVSQRIEEMIGNGHAEDSPRVVRLREQLRATVRAYARLGNRVEDGFE